MNNQLLRINPVLQGLWASEGCRLKRIVKLKMFLGSFDWLANQIILICSSENFVVLEKRDPCDVKWF